MTQSRQLVSTGGGQDLAAPGQGLMAVPDRIDLRGSVSFFRKRLGLIILFVVASLVVGAGLSFLKSPVYTANAMVSIEAPADQQSQTLAASGPTPNSAFVDTQVEIILSRELARRVAEAAGALNGKAPADQEKVITTFLNSVTASRSGESYALQISFNAHEANEAARIANEYARQFTHWELNSARVRNRESEKLVATRLEQLRGQAHADTEALQKYRIANNLLSTSGASLTEQEISSYNQAVTNARADAVQAQARLTTAMDQLRSGSKGDDVGEALGSGVVGSLRAREAEVGGQVANLEARYGPNHPQLIRAKGELEEIRRQIQAEIGRVISNLEAQRDVAAQRLASLNGSLGAARGTLAQNNAAMVGLDELERTAQASQALYETYLNSYKQLVAAEGSERPNARVLSWADVPLLPSSPNVPLNMAIALVIGLGLGIVAAYVAESLFHGVTSPDEVEFSIGERYLGSIPQLSSVSRTARREVPAIVEEPRSAFAEAFRSLRTSIDQSLASESQVVAITSALPREGKTTVSACLAQTLAISGHRTVLVDCDLRRRGVSRLLRLDGSHPGLIEVLEGSATLAEALVTGDTGLSVLTIRPSDSEPETLLTGEIFGELIEELRAQFDHVVLDLPPLLPVAAARVVACHADATVIVVRWRKTAESAVKAALHQLPRELVNVVGVAINRVDMRRRRLFGHTDPAAYYSHYRHYYQ